MKPRIVIQFACTAKEKRQIQKAAKRERKSVSKWLLHLAQIRMAFWSSADGERP